MAFDFQGHTLNTRFFPVLVIQDCYLEALLIRPTLVHTQEHATPVLGFGPASPWMNFQNGIIGIMRPRQEQLHLVGIQVRLDLGHLTFRFSQDVSIF